VKFKRSEVIAKVSRIPDIRFEDQETASLTSFAGLVIYQSLFGRMKTKERLQKCFQHLAVGSIYSFWKIFLWLVVHPLLGYRGLRHRDYYAEDSPVLRVFGLTSLPGTATISRVLAKGDGGMGVGRYGCRGCTVTDPSSHHLEVFCKDVGPLTTVWPRRVRGRSQPNVSSQSAAQNQARRGRYLALLAVNLPG